MSEPTYARSVVVRDPAGWHLRPLQSFVSCAQQFASKIEVVGNNQRVDGKSILELMGLAAEQGTWLSIEATGPDAADALEALTALFEREFGSASPQQPSQGTPGSG